MLYFSELKGKRIATVHGRSIGILKDFIFLASESPKITKVVLESSEKKLHFIPIEFFKKLDEGILTVDTQYKTVENGQENELHLVKNLLDKQIIDVKGGKVVRVNDVAIQRHEETNTYYIAGVDVGFRAILRWIHLEKPSLPVYRALGLQGRPHFLSWADIEPLELAQGKVRLKKEAKDLERMRPEDLADYLEKTNIRNVNKIVETLDEKFAADVIADLNVNYQTTLFKRFASEKGAKLVEYLDPDEAVDILLAISKEKRDEILHLVTDKKKKELQELIKYSKTPIGELIDPEFIAVSSQDSVGSALSKVKEKITDSHFTAYIYVVNENNELVGTLDLSDLITHAGEIQIADIMGQDVIVIHLTTPKEIATKKLLRYKLYALPVVEGNKKIIGIVTYDDLVEDILKKL